MTSFSDVPDISPQPRLRQPCPNPDGCMVAP